MLKDRNLTLLVEFLKEELNIKAAKYLASEGIPMLVNTTHTFKARQIPVNSYPALSVYRNTEIFSSLTKHRSQIVLNYALTHTTKINISPLIGFISMALNNALNDIHSRYTVFQVVEGGRRTESGVIYNDNNAGIEIYLNMYFDILEGSLDYTRYVV